MLPARGNYSDLAANVSELLDGEICYAIDQDQYYQKEGTNLVSVGATKAQGILAETAVQEAPSNGNEYVRKNGAWAVATTGDGGGGVAGVSSIIAGTGISVDQSTGDVTITADGNQVDVALDDLTDVDLTVAATDGQVLTYDNATSKFTAQTPQAGSSTESLDDLTDVDLTTPAAIGDVLMHDGSQFVAFAADQIASSVGAQPRTTFALTANGTQSYLFAGPGFVAPTPNPTITLQRGQTYVFSNSTGSHPFEIQDNELGAPYDSGVTNNNTVGDVIFVVPMDAPDTLKYACTVHSGMTGLINVLSAAGEAGPTPDVTLDDLSDVDLTVAATEGQALIWSDLSGSWIAGDVEAGDGGGGATVYGPFTPLSFHTFDSSSDPAAASTDLQDWPGPVATDLNKVGLGACDGRPTSDGCEVRGDFGTDILTGNAFSVAFWYMHTGATTGGVGHYIVGCTKAGVNTPSGLVIKVLTNTFNLPQELEDAGIGEYSLCMCSGTGQTGALTGAPNLSAFDGNWHHYIFSHDGSGVYKTHVDGVEVHSNDKTLPEDFTDAGVYGSHDGEFTLMGCRDDSCRNFGILDNFAVYDADITDGKATLPAAALLVPVSTDFQFEATPPLGSTTDLTDFSATAATAGQVPVSDGTLYVPTTLGLNALSDVDLTVAAADGEVLSFDAASGSWKAGAVASGGGGATPDSEITTTPADILVAHDFQEQGAGANHINMPNFAGPGSPDYPYYSGNNYLAFSESSTVSTIDGTWAATVDQGLSITFDFNWASGNGPDEAIIFAIGSAAGGDGSTTGFSVRFQADPAYSSVAGDNFSTGPDQKGIIYLADNEQTEKYLVGTKVGMADPSIGDNVWRQITFIIHEDGNGAQTGQFSCYVDGVLVDTFDRSVADSQGAIGGVVTGGASNDTYYFGGLRGATNNFAHSLDNLLVVSKAVYPYLTPAIDIIDTGHRNATYDNQYNYVINGEDITAGRTYTAWSGTAPLQSLSNVRTGDNALPGYGLRYNATNREYTNQSLVSIRTTSSSEYAQTPFSAEDSVFDVDNKGDIIADTFNNILYLYVGTYNTDNGSGGWVAINFDPADGYGGGPPA